VLIDGCILLWPVLNASFKGIISQRFFKNAHLNTNKKTSTSNWTESNHKVERRADARYTTGLSQRERKVDGLLDYVSLDRSINENLPSSYSAKYEGKNSWISQLLRCIKL
jgi:hypothetical protein